MLVAGAPFSDTHVPRWSLPLILWFPVGCVVSLLRIASCVALILVDSRWLTDTDAAIRFVLRRVLGIEVRWRHRDRVPDERHCMVSNHQTPADLMVLYRSPARVIQLVAPGIPRRATTCENHRVLLRHATAEQYRALARDERGPSVHLFPEGGMTDGTAMLRFEHGFLVFARRMPVVPVAIRAEVSFGLNTHTLNSGFLSNFFWITFAPRKRYTATVLPALRQDPTEDDRDFVRRVQQAIADELDIPIIDMTVEDKRRLRGGLA